MRLFIAAQSLKGTIESTRAAELFLKVFPQADVQAVSDGGNGFLNVIKGIYPEGKEMTAESLNPDGKKVSVLMYETDTAVYIESAKVLGLPRNERKSSLFRRTSEGLGILIEEAARTGKEIVVGLGGSSTVDMGGKMLERLGCKVEYYPFTHILKKAECTVKIEKLKAVSDVNAPLNGENGAVVFAAQKGASESGTDMIRKMFDETASLHSAEGVPRLGSAGGAGFAVWKLGGELIDNFEYFDTLLNLNDRIAAADAVITCEGHIDRQSFGGKITGRIIEAGLSAGKKVFVIAGKTSISDPRIRILTIRGHYKKIFDDPEEYFLRTLNELKEKLDE